MYGIDNEILELMKDERNRNDERQGFEFMVVQKEYNGSWYLND